MQDEDLCGDVLVSGLALPAEMKEFTLNGALRSTHRGLGALASALRRQKPLLDSPFSPSHCRGPHNLTIMETPLRAPVD